MRFLRVILAVVVKDEMEARFRDQVAKILDGMDIPRRDEFEAVKAMAAKARPDGVLVPKVSSVAQLATIADRLAAWRESGATTLVLQARQPEALQTLAELVL